MVGKEEVKETSNSIGLQQGAGENAPLKPKGNFERRPHRFELIDKSGRSVATNGNSQYLTELAGRLWPDQSQDPDRTGAGWDVQVAGVK